MKLFVAIVTATLLASACNPPMAGPDRGGETRTVDGLVFRLGRSGPRHYVDVSLAPGKKDIGLAYPRVLTIGADRKWFGNGGIYPPDLQIKQASYNCADIVVFREGVVVRIPYVPREGDLVLRVDDYFTDGVRPIYRASFVSLWTGTVTFPYPAARP